MIMTLLSANMSRQESRRCECSTDDTYVTSSNSGGKGVVRRHDSDAGSAQYLGVVTIVAHKHKRKEIQVRRFHLPFFLLVLNSN